MERELAVCREVAAEAGKLLRSMQPGIAAWEKGPADLVTEADLAAQRLIQRRLEAEFPDYGFEGEEQTEAAARGSTRSGLYWLVDPLDGTTNFVHGMDNYAVSIALCDGQQPLVGAVYDPTRNECFSAVRGHGAWCDGQTIHPSNVEQLEQALVAASFAPRVAPGSAEVARFLQVLYRCQAFRRLGSAALNLCYVGCGRLDAYWASCVKPWDVAAGSLIAQEAGAPLSALDGGPFKLFDPKFAAASTARLHQQLVDVLVLATRSPDT